MGVEPTRTGFANRCLSRSTITPLFRKHYYYTPIPGKIKREFFFFAKKQDAVEGRTCSGDPRKTFSEPVSGYVRPSRTTPAPPAGTSGERVLNAAERVNSPTVRIHAIQCDSRAFFEKAGFHFPPGGVYSIDCLLYPPKRSKRKL